MAMDLKSVLSKVSGKTTESSRDGEQYLAVKISSSEVLATTWSVAAGAVSVGQIGKGAIEIEGFENLLKAADAAVSTALNGLELPLAKTIFGVAPDWIIDGKIVAEKLSLLKQLCQELDLRPLGYVLLGEAIESYLKEIEGAPLTAILVGIDGENGWVTLSRAGKNLGTFPMAEGEDVAKKIEGCLRQFTQIEVLPARMIIYDGRSDLKSLEEKIMAFPWAKQLPFLHFPKVEILSGESVVKAIAIAGGTQLGGRFDLNEDQPEVEEVSAEEAGFVQMETKTETKEINFESVKTPVQIPKINLNFSSNIKNILFKLKEKFSRFPKISEKKPSKIIFYIILGLILLGFGTGVFLYFVPKAKVFIHVTPQVFSKELEATISGQFVSVSEIGSKKGVVTGKKLVGEKAKGTVTIANPSTARTFAAGTVLTSATGLKFVLASEVQMASGSGVLALATANAQVTAADIGEQYNLSSGSLFTIANFSGQAKNEANFSGGSSHQAMVVAKIDQDRLLATLSAELTAKAKEELAAQITSGQTLLPNAITSTIAKKRFSHDIDAEAENVSLDLTMDFKGITVSKEELVQRFLDKFGTTITEGYKLDVAKAQPEIKTAKLDKNGNAVLLVKLEANLLPEIDTAVLIKEISGKNLTTVTGLILKQTGVSRVEFDYKFKFLPLPWKLENISVERVSD